MDTTDYVVKIAEYQIAKSPNRLLARGLGSCVAITFYDPTTKIGALLHAMLPYYRVDSNPQLRMKYVDTSVEDVLEKIQLTEGVQINRLVAKIIGGSNMFGNLQKSDNLETVGFRNIQASHEKIKKYDIPIVAEDTGGEHGRTIAFFLDTGLVQVKTVNKLEKYI
jgi:chemotaxis protein CheD